MRLPRFYPILDTALLAARSFDLETAAEVLLDSGVQILQIRHKGHFGRRLFETCERVAGICRGVGALLVINDRADIAAMLPAALHLGQDDLPVADARRILPSPAIIGLSTHNQVQFREADAADVDYLAFGPVFPTRSKENPDPVVGVDELRRLRQLTAKPLVAIGGITRANAGQVLAAGADSVAVISDVLPDPLTGPALRERVLEWLS